MQIYQVEAPVGTAECALDFVVCLWYGMLKLHAPRTYVTAGVNRLPARSRRRWRRLVESELY